MNREKLLRYLRSHKCRACRQGGRHEIWEDATGDFCAPVPRHAEIKTPVVRSICQQLRVPPPTEK